MWRVQLVERPQSAGGHSSCGGSSPCDVWTACGRRSPWVGRSAWSGHRACGTRSPCGACIPWGGRSARFVCSPVGGLSHDSGRSPGARATLPPDPAAEGASICGRRAGSRAQAGRSRSAQVAPSTTRQRQVCKTAHVFAVWDCRVHADVRHLGCHDARSLRETWVATVRSLCARAPGSRSLLSVSAVAQLNRRRLAQCLYWRCGRFGASLAHSARCPCIARCTRACSRCRGLGCCGLVESSVEDLERSCWSRPRRPQALHGNPTIRRPQSLGPWIAATLMCLVATYH